MIKGAEVETTKEYFKHFNEKHEGRVIEIDDKNSYIKIMKKCGCSMTLGRDWLKLAGKTCGC